MGTADISFGPWKSLVDFSDSDGSHPYKITGAFITKEGKLRRKYGSKIRNSSDIYGGAGTPAMSIFELRFTTDAINTGRFVVHTNADWKEVDLYSGTYAHYSIYTRSASQPNTQACMFADQAIFVDGGVPQKATVATHTWTASNLSADGSMPQDSTACYSFGSRLWLNSAANPMKAYGSKVGVANASDSWSKANDSVVIDFTTVLPGGDTLLGFNQIGDSYLLFIFRRHICVYEAPADFSAIRKVQLLNFGALSNHYVKRCESDTYVVNEFGLISLGSEIANQRATPVSLIQNESVLAPLLRCTLGQSYNGNLVYYPRYGHLYFAVPLSQSFDSTNPLRVAFDIQMKNIVGDIAGNGDFGAVGFRGALFYVSAKNVLEWFFDSRSSTAGAAILSESVAYNSTDLASGSAIASIIYFRNRNQAVGRVKQYKQGLIRASILKDSGYGGSFDSTVHALSFLVAASINDSFSGGVALEPTFPNTMAALGLVVPFKYASVLAIDPIIALYFGVNFNSADKVTFAEFENISLFGNILGQNAARVTAGEP